VSFSPPLWQLRACMVDKTHPARLVGSAIKIHDIPIFHSDCSELFYPLIGDEPSLTNITRGTPHFLVFVIGSPARLLSVLNAYIAFLVSHDSDRFVRQPCFFPIARKGRTRLTELLTAVDFCYARTIAQVGQFLSGVTPQPALDLNDSRLGNVGGSDCVSPSPYHLLQRLFTFYADCATVVTNLPVWAVTLQWKDRRSFVTGAIDSVVALAPSNRHVNVSFRMLGCGPPDPLVKATKMRLVNFALPGECPIVALEDDALILTLEGVKDFSRPLAVANVTATCEGDSTVIVDTIMFTGVVAFSVERLVHRQVRLTFPIRTFAELDALGSTP
jgi:hypothetical protein